MPKKGSSDALLHYALKVERSRVYVHPLNYQVYLVVSSTACCDWLHEITVSSLHSSVPVTKRHPTYEYLEETRSSHDCVYTI
jgi:hypothetical protein